MTLEEVLVNASNAFVPILDRSLPAWQYIPIDLSYTNPNLEDSDIEDHNACQNHIDGILQKFKAKVAYGGYLEKRKLYGNKSLFSTNDMLSRNIHLGMDLWTSAGTKVLAPFLGRVHSFQNNTGFGDYGPTLILSHEVQGIPFHTLYGHLSLDSLDGLFVGRPFRPGEVIGALGTHKINGGYAPHLHFQIIRDMEGYSGDYPGVCHKGDRESFVINCPDPNILLKLNVPNKD
ncbi:MAG: peptidoglycan DD-metalloendopeptidase family protein [Bacteroidota bacterium]